MSALGCNSGSILNADTTHIGATPEVTSLQQTESESTAFGACHMSSRLHVRCGGTSPKVSHGLRQPSDHNGSSDGCACVRAYNCEVSNSQTTELPSNIVAPPVRRSNFQPSPRIGVRRISCAVTRTVSNTIFISLLSFLAFSRAQDMHMGLHMEGSAAADPVDQHPCVNTPSAETCVNFTYPPQIALRDITSLCSAMPFMAACSVLTACNSTGVLAAYLNSTGLSAGNSSGGSLATAHH